MKKQVKILVVDDDPDIREAVGAVLEAHSHQVITACDGIECLAKLKEEKPDLLVLDLLMPRMDGFAVLKELQDPRHARYAKIPVLILTSIKADVSSRRYELETGLRLDVDDYVEKPIDPHTLVHRVEKLLEKTA